MKLFSNERKTDTDCVSCTCNIHLLEINIGCVDEGKVIPKLKSSFRGFYPMQSGLMHSFIRKQSPRESPFSLHIPLSLWGSSREGKCRPCWHLRLPDKQAVHRMKCRQTFSKH